MNRYIYPKFVLLLVILLIKNASADNIYSDVHARYELAHDFAQCASYSGIMAGLKGITKDDQNLFEIITKKFRNRSIELSGFEVTAFNVEYELSRLYTFGVEKGLKALILSEQPVCEGLLEDSQVRYNYWLKNPRKSFLDQL